MPRQASACSCAAQPEIEPYANAAAVFGGVLLDVQGPAGQTVDSAELVWYRFEVVRVYKGSPGRVVDVRTTRDGASCGLEISGSGPFLVYAHGVVDPTEPDRLALATSLCSGTRSLADLIVPPDYVVGSAPNAGAPVPATVPPTEPVSSLYAVPATGPPNTGSGLGRVAAAAAAVTAGLGLVIMRRRRTKD